MSQSIRPVASSAVLPTDITRPSIESGRSIPSIDKIVGATSTRSTNPLRLVVPDLSNPGSTPGARTAVTASPPDARDASGAVTTTASRAGSTRCSNRPMISSVWAIARFRCRRAVPGSVNARYSSARRRSDASTSTTPGSLQAVANARSTAPGARRTPNGARGALWRRLSSTRPPGTVPSDPIKPATAGRCTSGTPASSVPASTASALPITARPDPFSASASASAPTDASNRASSLARVISSMPSWTSPSSTRRPVRRANTSAAVPPSISSDAS